MKSEKWKRIKSILLEAVELPAADRDDFLDAAGLSAEDRAELASLLDVEAAADGFLSATAGSLTGEILEPDALFDASIGQPVGVYEITAELGIGGMGAVYRAERADGKFTQTVAVKFLKREFNIGAIRRNFEREREILSRLNHPNIARLLDSGTTSDGVPYLVMEYVEGVPVDEFCRRHKLSLVERLKLFNKICDAVSFAHRNLVIHRDIKPSNIIVDTNSEPKLLDFGISKLIDADELSNLTAFGAMTPDYASPEQLRGDAVSTASDVYSLGVVLYQLLAGRAPFCWRGKTKHEIFATVHTNYPILPSIAFGDRNSNSEAYSSGQLEGDLDNIIFKAIAKEPDRRYATVEQFSADIWRHLDGLPIVARPATRRYRASKFVRRNRLQVIAAGLILLSLVGGITIASWQAREARFQARLAMEARRAAEIETEHAREEQRKAEKVTKFVSRIFDYANPGWFAAGAKSKGKARVIDVVEELSGKIDVEFTNEADVAATLHSTFAGIFHWISKSATPEIRESYQAKRRFHALRGLELRKQYYGAYHELVAVDMFATYGMVGTDPAVHAAILMDAILMLRDTNPRNRNLPFMYEAYVARLMLPENERFHDVFRDAYLPRTNQSNYQLGEAMLREALALWQADYPPDHKVVLDKTCWLAFALGKQEKWNEFAGSYEVCKQVEVKFQSDPTFATLMPSFERVKTLTRTAE